MSGWSWRTWAVSFLLLFVVFGIWSVATPLHRAPDEPAHHLRAAALVHGQVLGAINRGDPERATLVEVPAELRHVDWQPLCWKWSRPKPDRCDPSPGGSGSVVRMSQAGRYPPAYYAVVGLPTLVQPAPVGLYAVRLVSAALVAAFVATAVAAAAGAGRRLLVVGVGLAVTPMVAFLGGALNPNSTEVGAALALWTAGVALVLARGRPVPRRLVLPVTVGAVGLVLSRQISPFWLLLIAGFVLLLGGWRRAWELLRSRRVWIAAAVVTGAALAQTVWVLATGALDLSGRGLELPLAERVEGSWERTDRRVEAFVGVFGWLDVFVSPAVLWLYAGGAVLFLLLALRRPRVWRVVLLLLLVAAVLAVPIALEVPAVDEVGFYWQGRYTLPLAVGVPVLAAVVSPRRDIGGLAAGVLGVVFATAHVAAFLTVLNRYLRVGLWEPPVPGLVLVGGYTAAVVGLWLWLVRLPLAVPPRDDLVAADGAAERINA